MLTIAAVYYSCSYMYMYYPSMGLRITTSYDVVMHVRAVLYKLPYRCMKIF